MQEQEKKLQEEILGDARRKAERAVNRAKRDAQKSVDAVRERMNKLRDERLADAGKEAEIQARAILASIAYEKRRRWLARREAVIEAVFAEALTTLTQAGETERSGSLRQLLAEALREIGTADVTVQASPRDVPLLETVIDQALSDALQERAAAATVALAENADIRGGVVVETSDARLRCDNSYARRLVRLRERLRPAVARALEQAAGTAAAGTATDSWKAS